MIFGIYTNLNRDFGAENALKLADYLKQKNVECFFVKKANIETQIPSLDFLSVVEKVDIMVAFGGDGTMINIVRDCAGFSLPVLGINRGNLGFLTECDADEMFKVIDKVLAGDYRIEERVMLKVSYNGNEYCAVNEVELARGEFQHSIDIAVGINDKIADVITGDGVIVSTPTGSTAYSLSCGGAILSPELDAFIVTAVSPHSLHSRPMVISDKSKVVLETFRGTQIKLCIDGDCYFIGNKDIVTVTKSELKARFVRTGDENFYSRLIDKLYLSNQSKLMERIHGERKKAK